MIFENIDAKEQEEKKKYKKKDAKVEEKANFYEMMYGGNNKGSEKIEEKPQKPNNPQKVYQSSSPGKKPEKMIPSPKK